MARFNSSILGPIQTVNSTTATGIFTLNNVLAQMPSNWPMYTISSGGGGSWTNPDLANASYDSVSFSVTTQESIPAGLIFKPDGTKMYIIGQNADAVFQYGLSTAWDLSTASYDSASADVSGQEDAPKSVFFKDDGTSFYIVGTTSDAVYQYNMTSAWDLSTASYASKSADVSGQETSPRCVRFKTDGTSFYICGSASDAISQYDMTTAWDVSTASYASKQLDVSAQEGSPFTFDFSPNGDKVWLVGTSDTVREYTLSTAWDISTGSYESSVSFTTSNEDATVVSMTFESDGSKMYLLGAATDTVYQYSTVASAWTNPDIANASYDSVSVSVLTETAASSDLFFKPDGTKVYITDNGPDEINEYNLTTAWDLSTLSYVQNFSCASQDSSIAGTFFKPDGTKMYVVGIVNDRVNEYNLSTAWDISTASFSQNFNLNTEEPAPRAIYFKPDGTKMFITGQTGDEINEYSLSTAWDVSTASASQVFDVSSQETSPQGLFMSPNGDKLYIVGYNSDAVFQYSLTTAWDISTMSYDSISFSVSSQETLPTGIAFKPDGSKMYITGIITDAIYQYSTVAPAWSADLSSASYDSKSFSFTSQDTIPFGLAFNNNGTKMYMLGGFNDTVYQYSLSTAFDVSTASYDSVSFSVASQDSNSFNITFNNNGTKMYMVGATGDSVYQYSLSTSFDMSTASYDSVSFSVASQDITPYDVAFGSSGTKMYIVGFNNDSLYQYSLSTAYDLSTASYDSVSFSVATQETQPTDFAISSDGTEIYVVGLANDTVYKYTLSTAWDLSTASYASVSFSVASQENVPRSVTFNSSGSKMYILGSQNNSVFQYSTQVKHEQANNIKRP